MIPQFFMFLSALLEIVERSGYPGSEIQIDRIQIVNWDSPFSRTGFFCLVPRAIPRMRNIADLIGVYFMKNFGDFPCNSEFSFREMPGFNFALGLDNRRQG